MGRDWQTKIRLDWGNLNRIDTDDHKSELERVLDNHADVFKDELGILQDVTAKIHIDEQAKPRFYRPRTVPYALRNKENKEIDRLTKNGIIEPVELSDWAAPIVPVVKQDGSIRLCGDYKVTVNRAAKVDKYPLPRIDDLFASLEGGRSFTKLDLAHAYQQVPLDVDSKKLTTINTPKGLYQYT